MFITSTRFDQFLHPSVAAHKKKHWTVVTRALEAPWYVLVYDVTCAKGRRVSQTSLVACDVALVDMLGEIAAADLKGIGRLDRQHGPGASWGLRWIDALWKPAFDEARTVGPMLFRFDAETVVRDAMLRPVGELAGRRLFYSVGGAVERRLEGAAGSEARSLTLSSVAPAGTRGRKRPSTA